MASDAPRPKTLEQALEERILVIDGAMGTMVQAEKLEEADFRGDRFAEHDVDVKGNSELLSLTRPDIVAKIHRAFLDAGADIIETNTFGSTGIAQSDYGLAHLAAEQNLAAQATTLAIAVLRGQPNWLRVA